MRLYCSNIAYEVDEDGLREAFLKAGWRPTSVRIHTDRDTGFSRGFGYVTVPDADDRCITDMDGTILGGRRLHVEQARAKEQR